MLAISILFKMAVYFNGLQWQTFDQIARFANIFILMSGVFFAIRLHKMGANEATPYIEDFKAGLRIAALYAIAMSAFLYLYYAFIDPNYFSEIIFDPQFEEDVDAETRQKVKEGGEFVKSAFFHSTISLTGFLLLGSFYSAMIAFLVRKVRGFKHD